MMRLCWVDNARAIGIILVVYGHTQCWKFTKEIIYSFHMPLFFFLSGYLFKNQHLRISFSSFLKNNLKRLIFPYLVFWSLSYLLWLPTRGIRTAAFHSSVSFIDPVFGLFYGIEKNLYFNSVLWFFPCFFVTRLLFWFLHNRITSKLLKTTFTLALILGIFIHYILPLRLPWSIDSALVALIFFAYGHIIARSEILEKQIPRRVLLEITIICSFALATLASLNGRVAMDQMRFEKSVLLFFVSAAIAIFMIISMFKLIPHTIVGRWLSENTIIIFPYHKLAFNVFTGIGVFFFGLPTDFRDTAFFGLLFTIGAVLGSILIVFFVKRYMPWAVGLPFEPYKRTFLHPLFLALQTKPHRTLLNFLRSKIDGSIQSSSAPKDRHF